NHFPGINDGAGLLALKHYGSNLRSIGQIGDPGLNDLQPRLVYPALDLISDPGSHHLAGSTETTFVSHTVAGGVHIGSHIIWVDPHDVPQGAVALKRQILFIVIHVEHRFGSVHHPPHNGNADLHRVAQAVVDLLAIVVKGHDLQ